MHMDNMGRCGRGGHGGAEGHAGGCGAGPHLCQCSSILSSILRPALLLLIAEGKGTHGYELGPALEQMGLDVSTEGGRLYRALRMLEKEGLVSSSWDTETTGPARRIYTITPMGRGSLQNAISSVSSAAEALNSLVTRIKSLGATD